jgi:hypothetical protein
VKLIKAIFGALAISLSWVSLILLFLGVIVAVVFGVLALFSLFGIGQAGFSLIWAGFLALFLVGWAVYGFYKQARNVYHYGFKTAWRMMWSS